MSRFPSDSAAAQGLTSCPTCERLCQSNERTCPRCGTKIVVRKPASIQKTIALLVTATVLYFPANFLPIMRTEQFGNAQTNTILSGVITLWGHGSYVIASIIFFASVLVPIAKMLVLFWLCWSVTRARQHCQGQRAYLYKLTETVGRWSMIDVFVVAILVAMVQLGAALSIQPGPAALSFAGVVAFTMLAASSFDSRLIWDSLAKEETQA